MTTLILKIPEIMAAELEAKAKRLSKSKSEIVRDALDWDLHAPGQPSEISAYDALEAIGVIGCVDDLPPDLSTNRKYMEGYGR